MITIGGSRGINGVTGYHRHGPEGYYERIDPGFYDQQSVGESDSGSGQDGNGNRAEPS